MKILVVSGRVGRSPEDISYSFVFDEVVRLAKRRIEVHVARFKFEGHVFSYGVHFHDIPKKFDIAALTFGLKNLVFYRPLLRSPRNIYGEFLYSKHIRNLLERVKPDVLHAHFAYPEGWAACTAKLGKKVPLIVTLHGYDILMESSVRYGIRLYKKYDAIVKTVLNDADRVIVASRAVYEEATKLCNPDKIALIPNGVDTNRFNPGLDGSAIRRRYGIEDAFVVFTVRGHMPKYGIEYLIRAAPYLVRQVRDVIFVIGGDGPLRKYHERLAHELGVGEHVIFTGVIPWNELPLFYVASDVVVVPSLQEAWGLVVTEAMACGKPVIGSDVGGIRDQVINGWNGFLVPPRNPRTIAEKILYFIENPGEARKMGANGRRLVVEHFDIEKRIDRLVKLYEEVLTNSH